MLERSASSHQRAMTPRDVRTFFLLTFAVSWGIGALFVAFQDQMESVLGPMGYTNPVFILMVYTPGIIGVLMVWRRYGLHGLGSFFRRLTLWRMPWRWWLTLVIAMPAVFYAAAAITGTLGDPFPYSPWYQVIPAALVALFIGPIEELGWRGVALPLLQRRHSPLTAAIIVGVVAAVWHTPAFLLSGTKQSGWSYAPFFLGVVAISVILTPMFNAARGSLLVATLFHFQMNGPAWPDSQPWDMYLFAAVAIVVVLVNRRSMLTSRAAVTTVLMPGVEAGTREPARSRQSARHTSVRRRPWLAAYAALLAAGAYGGALGLVTGLLSLPPELEQRLPFGSPVLGGAALTLLVALPATVVVVLAWRGDPRTDLATAVDGILLVGWILVELAFIRELSYLHPLYLLVGVSLVAWGHRALGDLAHRARHPFRPAQLG